MTRRQMGIGKSYLKHSFKSNLGLQTQEKRAKTGFAAKGKKRWQDSTCDLHGDSDLGL